ncbi:DNA glycosylase AlkZ-like family protein [Winogradskya humida]|uniref:Winged helix DNA-binding protein n=1 Tax=Winogradskya humida TaxID=113566 RepID=A0ABQ3ZW84_9ACTN|nr:crosslink repair DNA glycosylase YcaQ family protein [Actinoplanes humidus]GIE22826.1 hypothetical protein Ahu01nite_059280 [Actinoplanes humidus]
MPELSSDRAREIAVAAQGLHLRTPSDGTAAVLRALGTIQLDTIHVVRRSHELVLRARGIADQQARAFLDDVPEPRQFEYWGHAASVMPLDLWPYLAFRRRRFLAQGWSGPDVDPAACDVVRAAVADGGAVTITDLGGAQGRGWERSAPAKWAAEWLLATGELVCVSRRGFSRVYRSAAEVVPDTLRHDLPDIDCYDHLIAAGLSAMGVATADDIADYFRLPKPAVRAGLTRLPDASRVTVRGWAEPAWVSERALEHGELDEDACTPLSPFDSLIWHRPRARRLFGIDYVLEAYKPAAKRECGYFGMPVLSGTEIIGRFAMRATRGVAALEGHEVIEGHDPGLLARAARTAAGWAGASLVLPAVAAGAS